MLPLHYTRLFVARAARLELALRGWNPQYGPENRCAKPLHYAHINSANIYNYFKYILFWQALFNIPF